MISPYTNPEYNRRILIVDDNSAIHEDFRKILGTNEARQQFDEDSAEIFGEVLIPARRLLFEMDFAFQGEEALQRVLEEQKAGRRYAMVFMDVRMPPGWNGLKTTQKLWEVDPDLQIVICTAYSDYSWEEMMEMLGNPERVLILKKPFDNIEVLQLAHALTEKWSLIQAARQNKNQLEQTIDERTRELKTTNALLEAEIAGHMAAAKQVREQATLLEKARDAIIVRDIDETILFWNHGAERLYGWRPDEAVGRNVLDLVYQGMEMQSFKRARESVIANGSWNGELSQKTKAAAIVTVECHWTLILDDQGKPKSILAINTDITEKKQIEAHLHRAQRMEGIGSLAGGIAHDLNNLLLPILLGIEMVRREPGVEDHQDVLGLIESSAQRAADVVKQLLFFAKGGDSRQAPVQAAPIIADLERLVHETFPKSIRMNAAIPDDLWWLSADSTQMHQVLLNLCLNARDAMPDGGDIDISAENIQVDAQRAALIWGLNPGPYVLLKIADTGAGIPPEILDKIFEPFFTTKEFGKGSGLGLSTVFGIVKNYRGTIAVRSTPGAGTTFNIYLPAVDAPPAAKPATPQAAQIRGDGEFVLVIDDEPSILALTKGCLEVGGYHVLTANGGREAIRISAQHRDQIALVLTDMMMPDMDGPATIQAIRKITPCRKFIGTSGGGDPRYETSALEAGASRFIAKPYSASRLLQTVREVLSD